MSIVNLIVQGVLLGGYYALLACGLSLMFGVMRIINLAHGDLAILSAFLVFSISDYAGISPFLALLAVLPIMAALGWLLQRGILERSLRSGMLVPLLARLGESRADLHVLLPLLNCILHLGGLARSQSRPIHSLAWVVAVSPCCGSREPSPDRPRAPAPTGKGP